VNKNHSKPGKSHVLEDDLTKKVVDNCFRFFAIIITVGVIATVIYLLQDILSENKRQNSDKFRDQRKSPNNINNQNYYGSRGGGYRGSSGGHYFSKGFASIYLANQAVGSRLTGSSRGGGGWGGFGRGGGGGCFEENSHVWTKNVTQTDAFAKKVSVKDLQEGSLVATSEPFITQKGKTQLKWTRATDVTVSDGIWNAHTFTFSNRLHLTVTSPHLMIIRKNGQAFFIRADTVQVGDIMFVDEKEVLVIDIKKHTINTKVSVETEQGTIQVNRVLVSGLCDYNPDTVDRIAKYHFILEKYIQDHFGKEYSNMCMDDVMWKDRYIINNGY